MFCPNCGAPDQNANAYCRQCGEWLVDHKAASKHGAKPEDRMKAMLVFNGTSALFALVSTVALYATYLNTPEIKWSIYMAGAFCSVIAVHQTVSFFFALGLRQKFKRRPGRSTAAIEQKSEPALLPDAETAPMIAAPSVTEKTTDLLEQSPRREGNRTR
jgi:hypothetical protein